MSLNFQKLTYVLNAVAQFFLSDLEKLIFPKNVEKINVPTDKKK